MCVTVRKGKIQLFKIQMNYYNTLGYVIFFFVQVFRHILQEQQSPQQQQQHVTNKRTLTYKS